MLYTRDGTPKEGKVFQDWLNAAPISLNTPELHLFQAFARNTFLTNPPASPLPSSSSASSSSSVPASPDTVEPVDPATESSNNSKTSQIPRDPFNFFKISKRSTSAQVSFLSAIAHMCALASSHANEHPLFHKMLFNPAELAHVFIPALPDDDMQMFMCM